MLEKLYGIDTAQGMGFCMDDEDIYREILEEYLNSDKSAVLEECFANKNWKDYQVYIHAVKSTSKTIGANKVADMALNLEMACKEGRENDIISGHAECMAEFKRTLDIVRTAIND